MHSANPYEYYETPAPFTKWLLSEMAALGHPVSGHIFEPCVGRGAIVEVAQELDTNNTWYTNDLDPYWPADTHRDAADGAMWNGHRFDWVISNPAFRPAINIATHALGHADVGVIMHLRASIHEVTKLTVRRTWMEDHLPTGILWLPRFACQRSPTTGKFAMDAVTSCWVVWIKPLHGTAVQQFIRYAPEWVLVEMKQGEAEHRKRMDTITKQRKQHGDKVANTERGARR